MEHANDVLVIDGRAYHISPFNIPKRVSNDFGSSVPKIYNGTILDAGCSFGYTTAELKEDHYPDSRVIGIDIQEWPKHDVIGNEYGVEFVKGDFYRLKDYFDPGLFNSIFAMNNLAYVSRYMDDGVSEGIAENFYDALDENGHLCISLNECNAIMKKKNGGFGLESLSTGLLRNPVHFKIQFDFLRYYGIDMEKLEL